MQLANAISTKEEHIILAILLTKGINQFMVLLAYVINVTSTLICSKQLKRMYISYEMFEIA